MDTDVVESLAELLDFDALLWRHDRRIVDGDIGQQHPLVKHLVVLEIVKERGRHHVVPRSQENRGACDTNRRFVGAIEEQIECHRFRANAFLVRAPSGSPCFHQHVSGCCDQDRQPAAFDDLERVRGKEHQINEGERAEDGPGEAFFPVPLLGGDNADERSAQHHDTRDGDPIRRSQRV